MLRPFTHCEQPQDHQLAVNIDNGLLPYGQELAEQQSFWRQLHLSPPAELCDHMWGGSSAWLSERLDNILIQQGLEHLKIPLEDRDPIFNDSQYVLAFLGAAILLHQMVEASPLRLHDEHSKHQLWVGGPSNVVASPEAAQIHVNPDSLGGMLPPANQTEEWYSNDTLYLYRTPSEGPPSHVRHRFDPNLNYSNIVTLYPYLQTRTL